MSVDKCRYRDDELPPKYAFPAGFADCRFCRGKGCFSCDERAVRIKKEQDAVKKPDITK